MKRRATTEILSEYTTLAVIIHPHSIADPQHRVGGELTQPAVDDSRAVHARDRTREDGVCRRLQNRSCAVPFEVKRHRVARKPVVPPARACARVRRGPPRNQVASNLPRADRLLHLPVRAAGARPGCRRTSRRPRRSESRRRALPARVLVRVRARRVAVVRHPDTRRRRGLGQVHLARDRIHGYRGKAAPVEESERSIQYLLATYIDQHPGLAGPFGGWLHRSDATHDQ